MKNARRRVRETVCWWRVLRAYHGSDWLGSSYRTEFTAAQLSVTVSDRPTDGWIFAARRTCRAVFTASVYRDCSGCGRAGDGLVLIALRNAKLPQVSESMFILVRLGSVREVRANSHRHARHDTDRTVLTFLVWRCELSRPDSQTGAFCSVSECVGRRSATAGRTPTQNALARRSVHTATSDTTRLSRLPVDRRRRDAGQAGSYA